MDDLALAAQRIGKNWASGNVSAIESGRFKTSLPQIFFICGALSELTGSPVTVEDIFMSDEPFRLDDFSPEMTGDELCAFLAGGPAKAVAARDKAVVTFTERRLAAKLKSDPLVIKGLAQELWGRSFEDERDARAGAGASAQLRGRRSRELQKELAARIADLPEPTVRIADDASFMAAFQRQKANWRETERRLADR